MIFLSLHPKQNKIRVKKNNFFIQKYVQFLLISHPISLRINEVCRHFSNLRNRYLFICFRAKYNSYFLLLQVGSK